MKKFLNIYTLFFFSLLIIDQLSKYLIRYYGGFYICNSGIAFGLMLPEFIFWLLWLNIIFFVLCIYFKNLYSQNYNGWLNFFLLLILVGAIGNIIDRLYFGCITDFIDLRIWPVFNFADVFITLGAVGIIIIFLKKRG